MPWSSSSSLCSRVRSWVRDYDRIQSLAVTLLYIQIGCALLGSLGALFNGVLLINLVVALFALVAIESSSQSLGRTYAVLLVCAIVLDISWFIFFSRTIWSIAPEKYGPLFAFSVKLALSMQTIGFSVRLCSSVLWIQMYRLGIPSFNSIREEDFDVRENFLNSNSDDNLDCFLNDSA
ncbi:uncharacterized protein LOC109709351 isoform X2 [Ananas comosus]|uniref:Uncharacterized protein LOC109709351 isoform X2 n=1 Tax=Ananas comosus TaxID=4615 RepID=A0A6P5EUH1_ANACO|nr:uncharacterized protein LOC109709351 isoform X2 [Ananas comosus]